MRKIKLGDVLDVKRGCSLSGEYYALTGKHVRLTLGNFNYPDNGFKKNVSKDNIFYNGPIKPEFILQKGDIITPLTEQVRGLLGNTATIPESDTYIQSGDIGLIKPSKSISGRFAYYLVSSPIVKKQLDAGSQQTKIRHTSPDAIKGCLAYVPDYEEQIKISKLLDDIIGKIQINHRINDNLSQQIMQIFDYWFKQYNFPNVEGKAYALSNGKFTYNNIVKRDIPENWTVGSLINNPLTRVIDPGVSYFDTKNYLATKNINGTTISDGDYVTYENRESRANMQPSINSVWFAKMKNSIKHLFVSKAGQPIVDKYILSTGFEGLQCGNNSFAYISGIISDPTFEITKDKYSHGATQQSVNNDDLDLYKIVIPDTETLEKYSKLVNPMYEKMNTLAIENNQLAKIRDMLLPLLLNGQVTIR